MSPSLEIQVVTELYRSERGNKRCRSAAIRNVIDMRAAAAAVLFPCRSADRVNSTKYTKPATGSTKGTSQRRHKVG